MTTPALQGIGLSRHYGGFAALRNVDIAVPAGEIRGLIGPNGAGKSTLIDVLSGRAGKWSGQVLMAGTDVSRHSPQMRRRHGMARSFQRTSIFPNLAVREQLELAAHHGGGVDEVLEQLKLDGLGTGPASELSYGDQRRLDLALALIGRPRVLLLDEPAAGLTVQESLDLARLLRDLVKSWGVSVLLVEHDMEVVFSICDRITVLHLGERLMEGTPDEVRRSPEVVTAYLGRSAH
ncbi:MAG: ABC transporter ATP-binding protein [Ferrovibrionaceae bacterium]